MKRIFLARPTYGPSEPEADYAARHAVIDHDRYELLEARNTTSMTCKNCNYLVVEAMNRGGFDYFAMQHADIAPEYGWVETMIERIENTDIQVVHAPAAFKNQTGITSTAIGYSSNYFAPVRRITTTELRDLPETFDVETLREVYDPDAERILLNTGAMVWKMGPWLDSFPGFTMVDRIFLHEGKRFAITVSEDYWFGHWCANNGVKVAATKIPVSHLGRFDYSTANAWGPERDEEYDRDVAAARKAVAV